MTGLGFLILCAVLGIPYLLLCLGRWGALVIYVCLGCLLATWLWESTYAHNNQGTDGGFAMYALCIPWFLVAVVRGAVLAVQDALNRTAYHRDR